MRNTKSLHFMVSLCLCASVFWGCSNGDESNSPTVEGKDNNQTSSIISHGTHALKANIFQANIATFSRSALGVCYAGTDIFLVHSKEYAQNQCIQSNGLEKHDYMIISVSKFDNGEFEIIQSDVYHEIVKNKNASESANIVYIDDTGSNRLTYQALSGTIVLSGITEKAVDDWKNNSGISVELKNAVFYDYPEYVISCINSSDGSESCSCKSEDGDVFTCDPQKLYDETKMQTLTYNQKFDLVPCENLTNVPDLDPMCE